MERKKLASKAAVICYGFGDLASQFVWTFVGSYLTIFYTDIVGLAPVAISVIMITARVWGTYIYQSVWRRSDIRRHLGGSYLHYWRNVVYPGEYPLRSAGRNYD